MQPPSQDSTNPHGHSSFYSQSEQPSAPPPPDSLIPRGQPYQSSPYPQTGPQFAPAPPLSSPQGSYPPGEEAYYKQISQDGGPITQYQEGTQGKLDPPPVPPKPRNGWKVVSLVLLILVIILATVTTTLVITRPSNSTGQAIRQVPTSVATQPVATSTSAVTQPVATSTSAATQPTPTTSTSTNYSAAQPGPGCDTGGGTWTPQGISNIACGTQLTDASKGTPAYLYFQLPNNEAFSANNEISIAGGSLINGNFDGYDCLGLAELDANAGFLVEYCGNGDWSISSISSAGAVVKTLSQGLTSERQSEQLSLTLKGTMISFSVDTEMHTVNISHIQPVKVAIMISQGSIITIPVQNFSYTTLSS